MGRRELSTEASQRRQDGVALLRGVNLGKRRVSMAELKKLIEDLGHLSM
jgi:hypothetical protein